MKANKSEPGFTRELQVAIELALATGSGTEFHGKRSNRTGVLYVAGEGHAGIKKRLRAWSICRGVDATSTQWPITVAAAHLRRAEATMVLPLLVHRRP